MSRDIISVKQKGNFKNTESLFKRAKSRAYLKDLNYFGAMGVKALSSATPRKTGKTASSWDYKIEQTAEYAKIIWTNSNVQDGVNIAVILDKGHGTDDGYWIEGRHYIDPAMEPVFEEIAKKAWKGVVE